MKAEIKIPAVGESINEATIAQWLKKSGDTVNRDDVLLSLETDKATVEVVAEHAGELEIKVQEGETIAIGTVVGMIDTEKTAATSPKTTTNVDAAEDSPPPPPQAAQKTSSAPGPAAKKIMAEKNLGPADITATGPGGRVTKHDAITATSKAASPKPSEPPKPVAKPTDLPKPKPGQVSQEQTRETMSKLRQTIARRLVEAQQTAALLTTFNEIDMSQVMKLRSQYKEDFKKKHDVGLGFMGFFTKAAIEALKAYPRVNAFIDGNEIVYNHYHNIGIAVGTEKGLMVPVIRNAEHLSLAEIELSIKHYAEKARDGKISVDDLSGGTFTISNGGVYGSLLSTPILNPPQSGILGLHKIEERPVAIDGKVEIRPMMYIALSYDHRMVDGKEAVSFLVKIKECMEDPARILLEV